MTWPEKGQGATRTFTAKCGDLGKRVVAEVALAADDAGLAGALAGVHVTGPAVGAVWEAVTRQAGVLVWGPVVILLQMPEAAHATSDACRDHTPGRCFLSNVKVPAGPGPLCATLHPRAPRKPDWIGAFSRKAPPLSFLSKHLSWPPAYLSHKGPGIQMDI